MIPSIAKDRRFCCFSCYRRHNGETALEAKVREALETLGVKFVQELGVGSYSVDFALADHKVAIEADGAYWHNPKKDDVRDEKLAAMGWQTVRIGEHEVNSSENLTMLIAQRVQNGTGIELQ